MASSFVVNKLKHTVWVLWHHTYDLIIKSEEARFGKAGLSHQKFVILLAIECMDDPVTITDLARWMGRNTNSISMIADRMEGNGLVKKTRDLPDRRSSHLVLTRKGKEKLVEATKIGWGLIERLTSCLSEEELEVFARLIWKLREKALEELAPGKTIEEIEEIKTDYFPKILRLLGRPEANLDKTKVTTR